MEASQWLYQIRSMPGGAGSAADPQEKINKYLEQVPDESREGLRSDMNERVKVCASASASACGVGVVSVLDSNLTHWCHVSYLYLGGVNFVSRVSCNAARTSL